MARYAKASIGRNDYGDSGFTGDYNRNIASIYTALIDNGATPGAAKAIIANILHETDNLSAVQERGNNKSGAGLLQWTGPRRKHFDKFIEDSNKDPYSVKDNVEFLIKEFNGEYGSHWTGGMSWDKFKKLKGGPELVKKFEESYLRAGKPHIDKREDYYKKIDSGEISIDSGLTQEEKASGVYSAPSDAEQAQGLNETAEARKNRLMGNQKKSVPKSTSDALNKKRNPDLTGYIADKEGDPNSYGTKGNAPDNLKIPEGDLAKFEPDFNLPDGKSIYGMVVNGSIVPRTETEAYYEKIGYSKDEAKKIVNPDINKKRDNVVIPSKLDSKKGNVYDSIEGEEINNAAPNRNSGKYDDQYEYIKKLHELYGEENQNLLQFRNENQDFITISYQEYLKNDNRSSYGSSSLDVIKAANKVDPERKTRSVNIDPSTVNNASGNFEDFGKKGSMMDNHTTDMNDYAKIAYMDHKKSVEENPKSVTLPDGTVIPVYYQGSEREKEKEKDILISEPTSKEMQAYNLMKKGFGAMGKGLNTVDKVKNSLSKKTIFTQLPDAGDKSDINGKPKGKTIDPYEQDLKGAERFGQGMEAAKIAMNFARLARNNRTKAPDMTVPRRTGMINYQELNPQFGFINRSQNTALEQSRAMGVNNINAIHRNSLNAKLGLVTQINQQNQQGRMATAQANRGIEANNNAANFGAKARHEDRMAQFGAMKGQADNAIYNSIFDSATNMYNYKSARISKLNERNMMEKYGNINQFRVS